MRIHRSILAAILVSSFLAAAASVSGQRPGAEQAAQLNAADAELNEVYKQTISRLDAGGQQSLREDERKWVKWRDEEADRQARDGGAVGGSAYREDYLAAKVKLTRQRTAFLSSYPGGSPGSPTGTGGDTPDTPGVPGAKDDSTPEGASGDQTEAPASSDPIVMRFAVRGLKLGTPYSEVKAFCDRNGLQQPSNYNPPERVSFSYANAPPISYVQRFWASNGQQGATKVEVGWSFTPPVYGGGECLLYGYHYISGFGEGVKVEDVERDLEVRFGKPSQVDNDGHTLMWDYREKHHLGLFVSAFIKTSQQFGESGELTIEANCLKLYNERVDAAQKAMSKWSSEIKRDATKPNF